MPEPSDATNKDTSNKNVNLTGKWTKESPEGHYSGIVDIKQAGENISIVTSSGLEWKGTIHGKQLTLTATPTKIEHTNPELPMEVRKQLLNPSEVWKLSGIVSDDNSVINARKSTLRVKYDPQTLQIIDRSIPHERILVFRASPKKQDEVKVKIENLSKYFAPGKEDKLQVIYSLEPIDAVFDELRWIITGKDGKDVYTSTIKKAKGGQDLLFTWNGFGDEEQQKGNAALALPQLSPFKVKLVAKLTDKSAEDSGEFNVQIAEVKVDTPDISEPRESGLYLAYELPADAEYGSSSRTYGAATPAVAEIFVKGSDDKLYHAPDGTEVLFGYESPAPGLAGKKGSAVFLSESGQLLDKSKATTTNGKAKIVFCATRGAKRWKIEDDGGSKKHMAHTEPDTFVVNASDGGEYKVKGQSPPIAIVAGKPADIEFLKGVQDIGLKLKDIPGPDGKPLKAGNEIAVMRDIIVKVPQEIAGKSTITLSLQSIKFGGAGSDAVVGPGEAILLIFVVRDRYGNPVPEIRQTALDVDNADNGYVLLGKALTYSDYDAPGYFLPADGIYKDSSEWARLLNPGHPIPNMGIGFAMYVTCMSFDRKPDKVSFVIHDIANGQETPPKEVEIKTDPSKNADKISKWLLEGEVEGKQMFMVDIAVSLIPFAGDAKQLFNHGIKLLLDKHLSKYDEFIAMLSLAGLTLDVASLLTLGFAALIDAIIKGFKVVVKTFKRIFGNGVPKVVTVLAEMIEKVVNVLKSGDKNSIRETVIEFGKKVENFILKIVDLNKKEMDQLVSMMGLLITSVQGLEALFTLFDRYTIREIMDLLWYAAFSEQMVGENEELIIDNE